MDRHARLVEALGRARRSDHESLVSEVYDLLCSASLEPRLLAALRSPDSSVRRRCARLLLQRPTIDSLRLLSESRDPNVRLMALRAAVAHPHVDDAVLQRSLRDGALPIRRRAFLEALRRGLVDAPRIIGEFMLDASSSIRDRAREWLREHRPDFRFSRRIPACDCRRVRATATHRSRRAGRDGGRGGHRYPHADSISIIWHRSSNSRSWPSTPWEHACRARFSSPSSRTARLQSYGPRRCSLRTHGAALIPEVWRAIESGSSKRRHACRASFARPKPGPHWFNYAS